MDVVPDLTNWCSPGVTIEDAFTVTCRSVFQNTFLTANGQIWQGTWNTSLDLDTAVVTGSQGSGSNTLLPSPVRDPTTAFPVQGIQSQIGLAWCAMEHVHSFEAHGTNMDYRLWDAKIEATELIDSTKSRDFWRRENVYFTSGWIFGASNSQARVIARDTIVTKLSNHIRFKKATPQVTCPDLTVAQATPILIHNPAILEAADDEVMQRIPRHDLMEITGVIDDSSMRNGNNNGVGIFSMRYVYAKGLNTNGFTGVQTIFGERLTITSIDTLKPPGVVRLVLPPKPDKSIGVCVGVLLDGQLGFGIKVTYRDGYTNGTWMPPRSTCSVTCTTRTVLPDDLI